MQSMEIKLVEELSCSDIQDILVERFKGTTITFHIPHNAGIRTERSVFPSITTPGTLLRSKLDDVDVLVVPTEKEIIARAEVGKLPPLGRGHYHLRLVADPEVWIPLCEEDATVIGWMDPTK